MLGIAFKMLFGDRAKLLGLVAGVAFATLLVAQQSAMFVGLMARAQNVILDAKGADIWVMDPAVECIDFVRPLRDQEVRRILGVPGVASASRLFKGSTLINTDAGRLRNALLVGVDDATLAGVTGRFVLGSASDLKRPDAIAIDRYGFTQLWPGEELSLGKTLELNEHRAVVTAITDASPAFGAQVIIYTRYSQAVLYVPTGRNRVSFVLATAEPGADAQVLAHEIAARTGLRADTSAGFARRTVAYYLHNTGIPMSFATTITLGAFVGCAIVGLVFNLFVAANLPHYAMLKAIGVRNRRLLGLVLFQATIVGCIGYAIGMGAATAFFRIAGGPLSALRGFFIPWWIAADVAAGVAILTVLAIALSLWRVLRLAPSSALGG